METHFNMEGSHQNYPVSLATRNDNKGKHFSPQEDLLIKLAIDSGKNYTFLHNQLKRDIDSIRRRYHLINRREYKLNRYRVSLHKKTIQAIIDMLISHQSLLREKFIVTDQNRTINECSQLINRLQKTIEKAI